MAYAGKEDREMAIDLANVAIHYLTTGENNIDSIKIKNPVFALGCVLNNQVVTVLNTQAVISEALGHNIEAHFKEYLAGQDHEQKIADINRAKAIMAGQTPGRVIIKDAGRK